MEDVTTPSVEERPSRSSVKLDAACAGAEDIAREAALAAAKESLHDAIVLEPVDDGEASADTAPEEAAGAAPQGVGAQLGVGAHLGVEGEGERVATHRFEADVPGYSGWQWSVTLTRAPRSKTVSVAEVLLLPGSEALLAPAWVPWSERVRPGDLHPGDLVPPIPDDPRLVPAYTLSDDPAVEVVCTELGLGRERVMSREGRMWTAERWFEGETGPNTAMARHAPAHCGTCGFYLALAGSMSAAFGVCANDISSSDGKIVSTEYGCGAHSEVVIEAASLAGPVGEIYEDDFV